MTNNDQGPASETVKSRNAKKCFMIYHFSQDSERDQQSHVINRHAEDVLTESGYLCDRPNLKPASGNIMEQVAEGIITSDVVYVNISAQPPNPNVYYELGIAHAMAKTTIIVGDQKTVDDLPFDIISAGVLAYDDRDVEDSIIFKRKLKTLISELDEDSPHPSSKRGSLLTPAMSKFQSSELRSLVFKTVTANARHPLTAVLLKFSPNKGLESAVIDSLSPAAKEFYGYSHAAECSHVSGPELIGRIKEYMDPVDYDEFIADQTRINQSVRSDQSHIPRAKVPVRFNDNHPNENYETRSFGRYGSRQSDILKTVASHTWHPSFM